MLPGDILVFPGRTFERLTAGYIHAPTYSALRMVRKESEDREREREKLTQSIT